MNGVRAGNLANWTPTSFFPQSHWVLWRWWSGNDNDLESADLIRSLRVRERSDKYDNVRVGVNSRLDTIQAVILEEKLPISRRTDFSTAIASRPVSLKDVAEKPVLGEGVFSSWAQYTLKFENRDHVMNELKKSGIPSVVYFPNQ